MTVTHELRSSGHALALTSVVADLHIIQLVNGIKGVHAVLLDGALHTGTHD